MAQDRDGGVYSFAGGKPVRHKDMWCLKSSSEKIGWKFAHAGAIKNWHQTILSRAEHPHLYPAPVEVVVENKTTCHLTVTDKPSIEQLASEYRNRKDYSDRKQQEADAAKADAEAKLVELVAAGKALGVVLSVAGAESELVITDWRDLRVGDVIECVGSWERENTDGLQLAVTSLEGPDYEGDLPIRVEVPGISCPGTWGGDFKFIRRPAKGDDNA